MNTVLMFALFLVLLALTAFFNLAEMALVAARASALHGAENGKAAVTVLDLRKQPGLFLAAIRAGDLITDLLTGAFIISWFEGLIRTGLGALPIIGGYALAVAGVGRLRCRVLRHSGVRGPCAEEHRPQRAGAIGDAHCLSATAADTSSRVHSLLHLKAPTRWF
jgi:Cyclin M transmembrane N-terminal domain